MAGLNPRMMKSFSSSMSLNLRVLTKITPLFSSAGTLSKLRVFNLPLTQVLEIRSNVHKC